MEKRQLSQTLYALEQKVIDHLTLGSAFSALSY